jgi:plasmid replication initiation protein
MKSASLSPFKRFAFELRDIARRQPLPGYRLGVDRASGGRELLAFVNDTSFSTRACGQAVEAVVLSGTARHVPSGTAPSCYQEPKAVLPPSGSIASEPPNLDSNEDSNSSVVGGASPRGKPEKEKRR